MTEAKETKHEKWQTAVIITLFFGLLFLSGYLIYNTAVIVTHITSYQKMYDAGYKDALIDLHNDNITYTVDNDTLIIYRNLEETRYDRSVCKNKEK